MRIVIVDTLGLCYDGETLSKQGLGGSESAVILISRELAKLGFDVTVFNNCIDSISKPGVYNGVVYIDHSQSETYADTPDIFISSRSVAPFWANHKYAKLAYSAKKRILWMHDTFLEGDRDLEAMLVGGYIDQVFTLSDFHTNYVTNCDHGNKRNYEVLKHRFWQTRNGAVKHIGEVDVNKKDPDQYVYNASVTKGLIPLLQNIWPEVKKQLPNAKLTVIGGYYRFRENAEPDEQEKTLKNLMQQNHSDVTFTGVIPQNEIAKILANASYMLYPTAFPETFGISSLESLLYKTPIITSRFGALEETAIDLACYKIDYSATNNALFKNINESEQTKKYVQTVVNAANNPYLHQQKQYYCEVVNDIHGWDSVALQWKQHFYKIMNMPLNVDDYRNVTRINQKVNRVFGRRYSNEEQINEYRSFGEQQRIVVVSPFWDAETYIAKNILSVAQQDYDNYRHVLIDDCSTDNSYSVAKNTIESLPKSLQKKFTLMKNNDNKGAIYNQLSALESYTKNDDIIILLDGDDWLINNNTIFHYYNDLYNRGYEFTYGSMWSVTDNIPLISQEYPKSVKNNKSYRKHKFNWNIPYTHLRTFRKNIANSLDFSVFKDEKGEWMRAGHDVPLFYELIERVDPDKVYCNREIVCNYNDENPLNDYKIRSQEQNINAKNSLNRIEKMNKRILIAIPTAKYIEVETFKSIYDLEIPDGYSTEFQFFYGYSISQIRNLIGEWAKNYDYLFSVDSDIVMPRDTLVKMISADCDIISGLYIQRIPNTHTLEIYKDTQNGGCTNIPYEEIEQRGIVEIAACGMGCALIKGEVFRKIEYPHFFYKEALDHKNTVSEDVYFCKKARSYGFKVWADESILCDHIGQTTYRVKQSQPKSHLEKIAEQDLLPVQHAEYLKNIDAEPEVIYDIGACVLHWTRKAKQIWPQSQYYLIDAAKSVEKFLEKSGHQWAIEVLSNEDNKEIIFYEDSENPGGNSYYLENTGAFGDKHITLRKTITLDTLVKEKNWPLPDMIKIDVQGAEIDVLMGAMETIKQCKDVILEAQHVDYNQGAPKVEKVIEFMEYLGFTLISNFCKGGVDGDYHFSRVISDNV